MAASKVTIQEIEYFRMNDPIEGVLCYEIHEITWDADKTIEVTTSLTEILFMTYSGATAAAPTVSACISTDRIISSGAVTVSTDVDTLNADIFRIVLWGYV